MFLLPYARILLVVLFLLGVLIFFTLSPSQSQQLHSQVFNVYQAIQTQTTATTTTTTNINKNTQTRADAADTASSVFPSSSSSIITQPLAVDLSFPPPQKAAPLNAFAMPDATTEDSLCINLNSSILHFVSPNAARHSVTVWDNAGCSRPLVIEQRGQENIAKENSQWFGTAFLVYHTLPSNLFHWTIDTIIPSFNAFLAWKLPRFNEEFDLDPAVAAGGPPAVVKQLRKSNIEKYAQESDYLHWYVFNTSGDFVLSDGRRWSWNASFPYFSYDRGEFLRRQTGFFLRINNEVVHENDQDLSEKFDAMAESFGFDKNHQLGQYQIAQLKRFTSSRSETPREHYRELFKNPNLDYLCFLNSYGKGGYPCIPVRQKSLNVLTQLHLVQHRVVTQDPMHLFDQCPHYWYTQLYCNIANKFERDGSLGGGVTVDLTRSSVTISLVAASGTSKPTPLMYQPDLKRVSILFINRAADQSRTIVNWQELKHKVASQLRPAFPDVTIQFDVIDLNALLFNDQMKYLSCGFADILVFVHGAGGAVMQFLPRFSEVLEICPVDFGCFYGGMVAQYYHSYRNYDLGQFSNEPDFRQRLCVDGACGKGGKIILPVDKFIDDSLKATVTAVLERRKAFGNDLCKKAEVNN